MSTDVDPFTDPFTTTSLDSSPPASEPATEPTVQQSDRNATDAARRDAKAERRKLRRVARKALDLAAADSVPRSLVADLFGATATEELAVEIMTTTSRSIANPLRDLTKTTNGDQVELGIELSAGGRPRMAIYWKVLRTIGAATGELPASDVKAAMRLAESALALTDTQRQQLTEATALASRS